MNKILKYCTIMALLGSAWIVAPESFVKKKKNNPTLTECCDVGADLLSVSARCIEQQGALQQQLITLSRDVMDDNKKSFLTNADKAHLKEYFDKTNACKQALEQAQEALDSYSEYLTSCETKEHS